MLRMAARIARPALFPKTRAALLSKLVAHRHDLVGQEDIGIRLDRADPPAAEAEGRHTEMLTKMRPRNRAPSRLGK